MTDLSTIEEAMRTEVLANGIENLIQEFQATAKGYSIPTSRKDTLALIEKSVAQIRKTDELIESIDPNQELPF